MAITTGIDIVNIARIRSLIHEKEHAFLDRVFSSEEIAYCRQKADPAQNFAARFAAKEAFIKAIPEGLHIALKDIEISKNVNKPSIHLSTALDQAIPSYKCISVSIAHEKEFAVAMVVIEWA